MLRDRCGNARSVRRIAAADRRAGRDAANLTRNARGARRIEAMIPLLLAAVVSAGAELHTSALAGVTLSSNLTQVLSEHPGAQRSANASGQVWRWSRRGGGTVTISADDIGNITRVDFQADKGQDGNIDLPCVGAFPVQDSDVNLNFALGKTACSAFNGAAYGLPDGSVVEVSFNGPGDGQLAEATWYSPSDKNPSPVGHMHSVIDYLRPALTYVGGVARIYYAGECPTKDRSSLVQRLDFPSVWFQPPLQGATGMDAVRQIFRDDPNVTVVQDRSKMLRITIGRVSSTVLQTRLPSLTLDPVGQYTALSAIDEISFTAASYAKEHGLPFGLAPYVINHLARGPGEGDPHLPRIMQNITIDDALDAVANTFRGIATYGECKQPDGKTLFRLGFIYDS
jgi:hypothetical protein